jgi:serine protease Do
MKRLVANRIGLATILGFALSPAIVWAIDHERNKALLAAFSEVVKEPGRSTVQVYCNGYRAVLGAIVREDGYIVTKASELKGKVQCELRDRAGKFDATIVGTDTPTDVALLKVNATGLPAVAWLEGPAPAVGSWLATPGLESKPVAIGVLSVGPRKLNLQPALGVSLDESDDVARIDQVMPAMPAERAGIQAGDIVRRVDGKEVKRRTELQEAIRAHQVGDRIELVIERAGAELTITAMLGSYSQFQDGKRAEIQNTLGGKLSDRRLGFPLVIQHDSVLKPADCGGPIVDLDGKAIGINIARAGRIESYALPSAIVRETVARLIDAKTAAADAKLVDKTLPVESEKKPQ